MVPSGATATQLRRGALEYCVLGLLRTQDRYAFDLVRELADRDLVASEGTIYPLLSRLRREDLVTTTWDESPSGPPRRYYHLTASGRARLDAFAGQWVAFREAVDAVLFGEGARP